jgi:multicomponent K+:H+ antiporter subunit E
MIAIRSRRVSPVLVALLTLAWLLLNQSFSPGHVVLGIALSVLLAWFGSSLRPLQAPLRRPDLLAGLFFVVLWDISRSNFAVARIVLGFTGERGINPAFVKIPLELRDDHALAVLACIVTSTPGTVWAGLSDDRLTLTLHVLDLKDEAAWVRTMKQRYERRLMEIFG